MPSPASTLSAFLAEWHVSYIGWLEAGRCTCTSLERVVNAEPGYVAILPAWGMGEGIALFAKAEEELRRYLASRCDVLAELYQIGGPAHGYGVARIPAVV